MSLDRFYDLPDWEQEWHQRQARDASERCPQCGLPREQCGDAHKQWFPQRVVCFATMETGAARAKYDHLHKDAPWHDGTFKKWSADRSDSFPYRFDWGVSVTVADRDIHPDDDFLSPSTGRLDSTSE